MINFSGSIVKNRGVKLNDKSQERASNKLYLEIPTLSLMNLQTVNNARIDGNIYFFNISKLPVVNRIVKQGTLLISNKLSNSESKTEISADKIGNNINRSGNSFYSSVDGFFVYENNSYQILPVIKNAAFSISVTDDAMQVIANFYPPAEDGQNLTMNHIFREFRKLKITAHPNEKLLRKTFNRLKQLNEPITNIVIAKGSNPEEGKNGWVEYLINTNKSSKPKVGENGRVDFYNLNTIPSVAENQKLAIVHPPILGKAGVDIYGRVTPPKPVKNSENPMGTNTYFDPAHANILLAKIGGYITKTNGKLNISDEYNVRGNIDFRTGNIISEGAVNINGDVKSGFKLHLDKSIIINGFVNDADIKSKGTISITGGFGGSGKGKIDAGGDVSVRFVRNQTIRSAADIIIAREAVDANLYAKGNVKTLNGQTIIIGGNTVAEKDVEVHTLGNEYGVKTKVQVGLDLELLEKSYAISLELKELKSKVIEEETRLKKYSSFKNLTKSAKQKLNELILEYKSLKNKYSELENKKEEILKILKAPSKSKVKVSGIVYPDVEIIINNTKYKVTEQIRNKTFLMSESGENKIEVK